MDVLSTVALVVQICHKLKQSVDKVAQNRRRLKELVDDVAEELADFEKVLQSLFPVDHAGPTDLRDSLDHLLQELRRILDACQSLATVPKRRYLVLVRSRFHSWKMRDDVEEDILRLREKIKTCRSRFTSTSSARTEHSVLVLTSEHRAHMNRVEGLVSRLLVDSNGSSNCFNRSIFPDDSPRDGIEYQYFHLQITKICERLGKLAATQTFPQEDPQGSFAKPLTIRTELPSIGTTEEILEAGVLKALAILIFVRQASNGHFEPTTIQDGAHMLFKLGGWLLSLTLIDDAVRIYGWSIDLYRTLAKGPHESTWLPYMALAQSCQALARAGTPDALQGSYTAVGVLRSLAVTARDHDHTPSLTTLLTFLSFHLNNEGRYQEALASSQEAVSIHRKFASGAAGTGCSLCTQGGPCQPIHWEGSGEEFVVFSSARAFYRAVTVAYEEALSLKQLAQCFANMARYSEAQIAATEAVNIFRALEDSQGLAFASSLREVQSLRSGWVVLFKAPPEHVETKKIKGAE
ncbi:hypothetical protein HGRIS_001970 [Hohenbuehelia grisea]|uniref:Fungal N-terminal domain-containing protein n=1 Tax=Hohenbuehelia grisea TaxID=104357 RepID=A0ABR3JJU3_9AGAR